MHIPSFKKMGSHAHIATCYRTSQLATCYRTLQVMLWADYRGEKGAPSIISLHYHTGCFGCLGTEELFNLNVQTP